MKGDGLFEKWLAGRPEAVQKLAREFPPGTSFNLPDGTQLHVIGYTDNDGVIASSVNPVKDFEGAMKKSTQVIGHASCIRAAIKKTVQ